MENGTWKRRMKHELHQLPRESTIAHTAKIGSLRCARHVIRMSDRNPTKMVLESHPNGTRRRGAQRAMLGRSSGGRFADSLQSAELETAFDRLNHENMWSGGARVSLRNTSASLKHSTGHFRAENCTTVSCPIP